MKYPKSIQNLIDLFCQLPTVGPKTAERYVFFLLKKPGEDLQKFAQGIAELKEKITICQVCGAVSDASPCEICSDPKRSREILCVVASTRDELSIESTRDYRGSYHVLGGLLSSINGVTPEHLQINALLGKLKKFGVKEIILALNPNLEGETTALYLTKVLKPYNIKITRLARGLPSGSDLEYTDQATLASALKNRTTV